jgi:hypothetical protein
MSLDLGLVTLTPQTGHCARAASQALLKELLGKGLARGWGEGAPSPSGVSGCVASAGQALGGKKGVPPLSGDWPASAPCQRPLGAATISEIYFGICSNRATTLRRAKGPNEVGSRGREVRRKRRYQSCGSRKPSSCRIRVGWRILRSAFASICRMRSRVTLNWRPTSSSVRL